MVKICTMTHHVSLILLTLASGLQSLQEEIHCKPKPGCQIARCDPPRWSNSGLGLLEVLENNDFPITCKPASSGAAFSSTFQSEYHKEITALKAELHKLQEKNKEQDVEIMKLKAKASNIKGEPCEINAEGFCFWTVVHNRFDVNFAKAEEICAGKNSVVALILNKSVYNAFLANIRTKYPSGWGNVSIWTRLTFNPSTATTKPLNAFTEWEGKFAPYTSRADWTNVNVRVTENMNTGVTGMVNSNPASYLNGVVCQVIQS